jgi:hypothetical protein
MLACDKRKEKGVGEVLLASERVGTYAGSGCERTGPEEKVDV